MPAIKEESADWGGCYAVREVGHDKGGLFYEHALPRTLLEWLL